MFNYILILIWSIIISLLSIFIRLLAVPIPKLKRLIKSNHLKDLSIKNNLEENAIIFCSSAGEYEQALPIINRLKSMSINPYICFFSTSGTIFAARRKEKNPYFLSPNDTLWNWNQIFRKIKPRHTFIIRHELWPAFLYTAQKFSKVHLINASASLESLESNHSQKSKQFLFQFIDDIDLVNRKHLNFYRTTLDIDSKKIFQSGDTKYDRVYERAVCNKQQTAALKSKLNYFTNKKKILIVGSAWKEDLDIVLPSYTNLKKEDKNFPWKIIIALHEPQGQQLNQCIELCNKFELKYKLYTDLQSNEETSNTQVLIVDEMGILGELYGLSTAAYVGGANHHKIHNVLEPAAYQLPITFGPQYHNSQEAVLMIDEGFAKVSKNVSELRSWWINLSTRQKGPEVSDFINKYKGAADKVIKRIYDAKHTNNVKVL